MEIVGQNKTTYPKEINLLPMPIWDFSFYCADIINYVSCQNENYRVIPPELGSNNGVKL